MDGPLAFDSAISAEAAFAKEIRSEVAGDGDLFLVPDLVSGNILVKDLEHLVSARLVAFVVGTQVPTILDPSGPPPGCPPDLLCGRPAAPHRQGAK